MYFGSIGTISSIVAKEGRFVITFQHQRHADEAVGSHAYSRDWNVQYGDWQLEPPGPPRALPSARPRATLQGPALPRALQRRPSGALGGAAERVLEAPTSAPGAGDISPSASSSGLRKTSAGARGFKSRGEESGANRKKTVLGIGGEHHESLQTEFQFPDALEMEQLRMDEQEYCFCVEINQCVGERLRDVDGGPCHGDDGVESTTPCRRGRRDRVASMDVCGRFDCHTGARPP